MINLLFTLSLILGILANPILQSQDLPRRSFLGVSLVPLDAQKKSNLKFDEKSGILVKNVFPESSADDAGIKVDDVILRIANQEVSDVGEFVKLSKIYKVGEKVNLLIWRNQKAQKIKLKFKELPRESSEQWDTFYESVSYGQNLSRVIITRPKTGKSKYPAVMLIQGVTCGSVDYPFGKGALMPFVDSLSQRGYVTIRVEKSGVGDSKGEPCMEIDFQTELACFRAGHKYLKQLDYVDNSEIYMFGWSMGGVIAPILASEDPVKGIAVFGTLAKTWVEYEMENSRRQMELTSNDYINIDKSMRLKLLALNQLLVEKQSPEAIIAAKPELKQFVTFYPRHYTYFQQLADLNLSEYWSKVKGKVLSIHGKADFVSSAKSHEAIAKIVNQNQQEALYIEMPNVDHFMIKVDTEAESIKMNKRERNYKLIEVICNWIEGKNVLY